MLQSEKPDTVPDERTAQVRLLRAVLDSASEPLWVIGNDGNVVLANAASARALGYARGEQLLGLPSHETLHHMHSDGSRYDSAECPIIKNRHRETSLSAELFVTRSDNIVPVTWATKPLPGVNATLLSFTVRPVRSRPIAASADLERQIDSRFSDPNFSATVLAQDNHLSIRALQLAFASLGASPAAKIRDKRLHFARALIESGSTVHDAAYDSGFREPGSFTRAFRKKYGINPSEAR